MNLRSTPPHPRRSSNGFSLIELMTSVVILMIILVVIFEIVETTRSTLSRSQSTVSQFRIARTTFETMSRRISQAVLNTYWDYDNPLAPREYKKQSELHFIIAPTGSSTGDIPELLGGGIQRPGHGVFFQGPFNYSSDPENKELDGLLNSWGYYIEHGSDSPYLPPFTRGLPGMQERFRFRLMEFRPPSEKMQVYQRNLKNQPSSYDFHKWFKELITTENNYSRPIADNVIALVISPRRSRNDPPIRAGNDVEWDIAPNYHYNSREFQRVPASSDKRVLLTKHQLPPLLHLTMVTIDETSALRLEEQHGESTPDLGLTDLFHDANRYAEDLATLESSLQALNLNYSIFTNTIIMRAAKWSSVEET